MDPILWDALKWVLGIAATTFIGIGAYLCKGMAADIKELQGKEQQTQVLIAQIMAKAPEREKLQDERWQGLHKDLDHQAKNLDRMQRDLQALVHSQIKQLHHSKET